MGFFNLPLETQTTGTSVAEGKGTTGWPRDLHHPSLLAVVVLGLSRRGRTVAVRTPRTPCVHFNEGNPNPNPVY